MQSLATQHEIQSQSALTAQTGRWINESKYARYPAKLTFRFHVNQADLPRHDNHCLRTTELHRFSTKNEHDMHFFDEQKGVQLGDRANQCSPSIEGFA